MNPDEKEVSIFLEEALIMKDFNHPNILPLYGVVFADSLPFVVFEFMDEGNLKSYIIKKKDKQVSFWISFRNSYHMALEQMVQYCNIQT